MAPASHENRPFDPTDCPRIALEPTKSLTQLTIWAALGPIGSGMTVGGHASKTSSGVEMPERPDSAQRLAVAQSSLCPRVSGFGHPAD